MVAFALSVLMTMVMHYVPWNHNWCIPQDIEMVDAQRLGLTMWLWGSTGFTSTIGIHYSMSLTMALVLSLVGSTLGLMLPTVGSLQGIPTMWHPALTRTMRQMASMIPMFLIRTISRLKMFTKTTEKAEHVGMHGHETVKQQLLEQGRRLAMDTDIAITRFGHPAVGLEFWMTDPPRMVIGIQRCWARNHKQKRWPQLAEQGTLCTACFPKQNLRHQNKKRPKWGTGT